MRIAVVSDIHGNLTALEAVLADLRQASPDLVLHGGDLADGGSSPAEVIDRIRDLGWQGVLGNTDEMLFRPESLDEFASRSQAPPGLWTAVREMAAATRAALGEERLAWLRRLSRTWIGTPLAVVHARPESLWRAPAPEAADAELESIYSPLGQPVAVYGHIHRSFIRSLPGMTVANAGSAGLSYDGDPRASYLLLEGAVPSIHRVEYDLDRETTALFRSGLPRADWVAKNLRCASPQLP